MRQVDEVEQFVDAAAVVLSGDPQSDQDVRGDGHVREQAHALDDVTDPAAQQVRRAISGIDPVDFDRPCFGHDEPVDRANERRFART